MRLRSSSHRLAPFHTSRSIRRAIQRSLAVLGTCSILSACGGGDPEPDDGSEAGGTSGIGGSSGTGGSSGSGGVDRGGSGGSAGSAGAADGPFILLKDINEGDSESDSDPHHFTRVGDEVFFAVTYGTGQGLWATDGTAAGTRLVYGDVVPDSLREDEEGNGEFVELDGKFLFRGAGELWISDGTTAGTMMLKDIKPGSDYSYPVFAERFGNRIFFLADDGVSGMEPWVTDGTAAGTYRVADTSPGPGGHCESGGPHGIAWNDKYYFYCVGTDTNFARHTSFWVTDGTAEGTTRLAGGTGSGLLYADRILFQDRLFFSFPTAETGEELWVTDGTSAGTTLFKDCAAGTDSFPQDFHVLGDKLLFFAYDDSFDVVLWSSDGTPAGTTVLARAEHAPNHENMQLVDGRLVFNARPSDASAPFTLWVTDGTAAGTTSIADVAAFSHQDFAPLGDELLFFGGPYASTDIEPWVTDGTASGTRLVKDIVAGDMGSVRGNDMVSLAGKAYFPAKFSHSDVQFFVSDGTEAGTRLLTPDGATNTSSPMGELFVFDDMLLVTGTWNDLGGELYRYRPGASR